MTVLIATLCIGDKMRQSGELSIAINRRYAETRGYDFFVQRESMDASKTPHWTKLLMLKELLKRGHDLIFYIDCDAIVTDFSVSVESVAGGSERPLTMGNENRDIFNERRGENTGVMVIMNDARVPEFIDDCMLIYDKCRNSCVFEQEAVGKMLETPKWSGLWNRVPCRRMNSYFGPFATSLKKPWNLWLEGDFVMHCLRTDENFKVPVFERMWRELLC